ncbi:MAG: pyridoxal phosphate-dependent aminotransferase [Rhodocyclaceae bacterium]|nr:pyridoxal phosphate-dependent aminotransferase [Rhodocyclaceae bacterium]
MPHFARPIPSRLPGVGTTIFSLMSRLAQDCGAINLSQGFPDYAAPEALLDAVARHMRAGANQYAPMAGALPLREAIAAKVAALYGADYDVDSEITVTAGATQAIFSAIACMVRPGDEVVVFEPVYDSYVPGIRLNGGTPVAARLSFPGYRPDWDDVRRLITPRTRMIMLNSPHNPTGSVWEATDLCQLEALVRDTNIVVVGDEVYEHMVYDGRRHESLARYPALAERSFIVSSFGKTYHATGWKVAYCLAPRELMAEFRKVHQFVAFCVNTPCQLGLADFMKARPDWYAELGRFYQRKRDFFRDLMATTRFELLPCDGTYFQCVRYTGISDEPDCRLAERLTREIGVASIPVSAFYRDGADNRVLRFCFAKNEETLTRAVERLGKL